MQVAVSVGQGSSNRDAAAQLFISPKTVEHHLSSIYQKLGLRSRIDLARMLPTLTDS
jgi:DNA-binding NarL/FixJ family response regulator